MAAITTVAYALTLVGGCAVAKELITAVLAAVNFPHFFGACRHAAAARPQPAPLLLNQECAAPSTGNPKGSGISVARS